MDFKGKLGNYKIIETEDNTLTVYSEYFDEACHNLSGAYNETLYNYISGCFIPEQIAQNKNVHVLDVGFGIGLGLKALIATAKEIPSINLKDFSYTSMELDEDLFLWSAQTNFPELNFTKYENTYQTRVSIAPELYLSVTVYIGDGRKTLPHAYKMGKLPMMTAIFQDAFSPKKNPTLWTVEWFEDLKKMSHPEVYLSTYSSSVSIRKTLLATGWQIENAKGFGQKKTMTKARLIGTTDPLLSAELSRSKALELRDI
ncbi:tRNA U34 5-methylaminomethyl-2-thiouridine-forming methyltransferase MnmC [Bacteriovorax stolpii]|nr:MnmC family methyltransferase [Bacteriovorax stolpii]TDP52238.1 tRNA U34 5-methylaminomethyl-2-thiouridine-forming methyltransferase MnmC [Bacteriovorax stolpii]